MCSSLVSLEYGRTKLFPPSDAFLSFIIMLTWTGLCNDAPRNNLFNATVKTTEIVTTKHVRTKQEVEGALGLFQLNIHWFEDTSTYRHLE
jgi:hypothetical protein